MRKKAATGMILLAVMMIGFALVAQAADAPTEEPWTNDMNQESYWETRFGVDCTKYENHSGYIPFDYDVVIVKSGSDHVTIWTNVKAGDVVNNGINPANGKPYGSPYSWVMKCNGGEETTTTTQPEETTTTRGETTTTAGETTTTTVPTTTTSTSVDSTTTSSTTSSTTSTSVPSSSTSSTSTSVPASSTSSVPPSTGSTLPFTGFETAEVLAAGIGLLAFGALFLVGAYRPKEDM